MKKTILIVGLVVAALVVLGVGAAFAQGTTPYTGNGPMMQNGSGWMHNYVEQALATKLGLTEKQVEDQLAAGKSMYQIALDNGIKSRGGYGTGDCTMQNGQGGQFNRGAGMMNGNGRGMMGGGFGWQNQQTNP